MTDQESQRLDQLMQEILEMKKDISELRRRILNPDDGLIVQTNHNTWWRQQIETQIKTYDEKLIEFESLKKWKETVTRAIWIAFSAIIAIIVKMLFDHPV